MELARFITNNPQCSVVRPDVVLAGVCAGGPVLGVVAALAGAIASDGWLGAVACAAAGVVSLVGVLRWGPPLWERLRLHRLGRACIAVSDDDVLLIDAAGNAVVVALDRITGLELDGLEVRLRTDSELQGVIYAMLFQLFDDELPGPSPDAFFEALAPRLRQRAPQALIVHHHNERALA